jgi:bifunctional UDP-N-acetylglucosamine pyrophosphorylase/glucosamine-1-phosphate N-acetyltransferase
MKAVILAAGEGKRMHPLTVSQPKVMLPIANRPIVEHLMVELRDAGIDEFLFVVGYRAETVRSYFGDGHLWNVHIDYVNQRNQAGTGDALRMAESLVQGSFILANGDIIVRSPDISRLIARGGIGMTIAEVEDATDLGVVELSGGRVTSILEKVTGAQSRLANAGVYLFDSSIFGVMAALSKSPRGEYELTSALQMMIDRNLEIRETRVTSWLNISYPWDLLAANEAVLSSISPCREGTIEPYVVIKEPVVVGRGTVIRSGAYITGPALIGRNCDIGPNCYIRPGTVVGDGCHIGNGVEIKNSIIMFGTKVPHLSYVGDSVIAENCNLGAGSVIANLRFDKGNIRAAGSSTGRHKFGAVIGANVQIGINASINVGTVIGSESRIGPGANVHGTLAPRSRVF